MSRILLIETATEVCSAAIAVDGQVVALEEEAHSLSHASLLTLQIEACVRASGIALASLDAIAVSRGPGSYTALRVGASVAKGLCYALDKPLIAVDTLLALAWAMREIHVSKSAIPNPNASVFLPMIDARRQEVWLAAYDAEMHLMMEEQALVLENNSFENLIRSLPRRGEGGVSVVGGNGSHKVENVNDLEKVVVSSIKKCSAGHFAALSEHYFQLADFQDVAYFEPFYMKAPNITTPSRPPF